LKKLKDIQPKSKNRFAEPIRVDFAVPDSMGTRLKMIYSNVTCWRCRLGQTELDFCRSGQQSGIDGARPKTHRPGMEPRNRGGDAPPPRASRGWTVENRRMDGAGRVVVYCTLRCARAFRAAAALSPARRREFIAGIGTARRLATARHLSTRGRASAAKPAGPPRSGRPVRKVF